MKVSKATEELEVGEVVWVKARVDRINYEGKYIRVMPNASSVYLDGHDEISLTEPQGEKVELEAEQQFVADWYEANKWDLEGNMFSLTVDIWEKGDKTDFEKWFNNGSKNCAVETLIKMKLNGYTVKPKRWVVKDNKGECVYELRLAYTNSTMINTDKRGIDPLTFTDRAKADAVAVLVDGSVEEV